VFPKIRLLSSCNHSLPLETGKAVTGLSFRVLRGGMK
jgi:hypothetical protein